MPRNPSFLNICSKLPTIRLPDPTKTKNTIDTQPHSDIHIPKQKNIKQLVTIKLPKQKPHLILKPYSDIQIPKQEKHLVTTKVTNKNPPLILKSYSDIHIPKKKKKSHLVTIKLTKKMDIDNKVNPEKDKSKRRKTFNSSIPELWPPMNLKPSLYNI